MTRIAVVDHGAGNLVSIEQGLRTAGAEPRIARSPDALTGADAVVLPGVGSTGAAMRRLRDEGLDEALRAWDGPLLGICVGLQLFFAESEEADGASLGLLGGGVRKLAAPRLPHMGWNDIATREDVLFDGIPDGAPFYFVHSYAPEPTDESVVVGTAEYAGTHFVVAVRSGNLAGVQFHPERSGRNGLRVLTNFVRSVRVGSRAA